MSKMLQNRLEPFICFIFSEVGVTGKAELIKYFDNSPAPRSVNTGRTGHTK